MSFTPDQREALSAKLCIRHVKTRLNQGTPIAYVEGWHVIAEANRIFGYDSWDRHTVTPTCVLSETQRGQTSCLYTAKARITVRAGGETIVREGIGTGTGRSANADLAHEIALKAAETDATKRALSTFGNPFGLALYDKDKLQVTKSRRRVGPKTETGTPEPRLVTEEPLKQAAGFTLIAEDGDKRQFDQVDAFVAATLATVATLRSVDSLYAFWQANLESFAALRKWSNGQSDDSVAVIVAALKARARDIGDPKSAPEIGGQLSNANSNNGTLALPKDQRIRSKPHLQFVANQPCLICGRRPAQAHHLRFAQPRAMALKVSDEFTVPLCNGHHDSLHRTGDERAWWARHGILDPLKIAGRLWAASRLNKDSDDDMHAEPEVKTSAPSTQSGETLKTN